MSKLKNYLFFLALICTTSVSATTINPFPNLGEMAKASEAVVSVVVLRNYTEVIGDTEHFRTLVKVEKQAKGYFALGETFILQNYHSIIGDMERTVWGDLELEEGENYLLFLAGQKEDYWQPMMLSYGAFQEKYIDDKFVYVPIDLGTEVHLYEGPGAITAEPLGIYESDKLIYELTNITEGVSSWNAERVATPYTLADFASRGTPPSHCSFLIGGTPIVRWADMENTSLPVWYHVNGDPGCATVNTKVQNSIGIMNGAYTGLSLTNGGTHNYIPTCGSTGSTGSEFTTFVNNTLGGNRHLVIQYDDPCDEIPDLSGCSGTLAFGGLYASSATHTGDGMTWRNALYGYVVVNNGTGACQCSGTGFNRMIEHEMTHSLNVGHISTGAGQANMNPSCCNVISPLDIECLDFLYAPNALPVELLAFSGKVNDREIDIFWETAAEYNSDYFIIEKINARGEFEPFAEVKSKGDASSFTDYVIKDRLPFFGDNYYRLVQVDLDGQKEVFETITVNYQQSSQISINPNPMTDNMLNVQIIAKQEQTAAMNIYDITGRIVHRTEYGLVKNTNSISISLQHLPPGLYYLQTNLAGQPVINSFVK